MSGIKRSISTSVVVDHRFNGGLTVDDLRYFLKLCDKAELPGKLRVDVERSSSTFHECGLRAQQHTTKAVDLPVKLDEAEERPS